MHREKTKKKEEEKEHIVSHSQMKRRKDITGESERQLSHREKAKRRPLRNHSQLSAS